MELIGRRVPSLQESVAIRWEVPMNALVVYIVAVLLIMIYHFKMMVFSMMHSFSTA